MTKSKAIEETDFAIIMARERVLSIRNQKQTTSRLVPFVTTLVLFLITFVVVDGQNLDRFNYVSTKSNDYGPSDWQKVKCQNVDSCIGYPDKFRSSQGWEITSKNFCQWCPASGGRCKTHHNSPINLDRNIAIPGSKTYNECIDGHWMGHIDSSCSYDELKQKNAFIVDRHVLKIIQPISGSGSNHNDLMTIDCTGNGQRRWGRIDFPKGYSDWWLLSHIDFHVPSEHTQNGKRYAAELQMFHFYSVSGADAGIDNEMGTVSMFLQDYSNSKDWDVLNKIICAWREAEEKNLAACGLPSVKTSYSGCPTYTRGRRQLRKQGNESYSTTTEDNWMDMPPVPTRPLSAHDVLIENYVQMINGNNTFKPKRLLVEDYNLPNDNDVYFDWDTFLNEHSQSEYANDTSRHLQDAKWYNYFPMPAVKTEYFFRYSGTQTVPPCYGSFIPGPDNRKQTNAWRVMKDPIVVSTRQINEMHRLLRERISPRNDPVKSCQADTAGKASGSKIDVARPLQANQNAHFGVFCECINWKSKFPEDQNWCKQRDLKKRLLDTPYNFPSNGF